MIFALVALARGNLALEAAGVFLLSSQGALFGPSKYGLLPELLPEKDLSWGNGVIELGTFLAAISATVASGFLAFYFRGQQHWSGVILLGCTHPGPGGKLWHLARARRKSRRASSTQSAGRSLREQIRTDSRATACCPGPWSAIPISGFWRRCCNSRS